MSSGNGSHFVLASMCWNTGIDKANIYAMNNAPVRVRYGVSFVGPPSDWYTDLVPAIIYAIFHIGPRYNGTKL